MPPKNKANKGQEKSEQKKREKIAEDKTFGLKNKNKSAKVQKYIAQVQTHAKNPQGARRGEAEGPSRQDKKKEAQRNALLSSMLNGAFSFDKSKQKKKDDASKKNNLESDDTVEQEIIVEDRLNLFVEMREQLFKNEPEKLEEIKSKQTTLSEIICRHFLEAVEKNRIGFRWMCPNNGHYCQYRHYLPQGFDVEALRNKGGKIKNKEDLSSEEVEFLIEIARSKLLSETNEDGSKKELTTVTEDSFKEFVEKKNIEWKEMRERQRMAHQLKQTKGKNKKHDEKDNEKEQRPTGKELFTANPIMFADEFDEDQDEIDDQINNLKIDEDELDEFDKMLLEEEL